MRAPIRATTIAYLDGKRATCQPKTVSGIATRLQHAVAAATGVGRTTLPRPTLRAVIDQHRHQAATSGTLTGLTDEIATLRTAVEAIADRLRCPTTSDYLAV